MLLLPGSKAHVVNLVRVGYVTTCLYGKSTTMALHSHPPCKYVFFHPAVQQTRLIGSHTHRRPLVQFTIHMHLSTSHQTSTLTAFFQSCPLEPTPASMRHKNRAGKVLCIKMQFVLYTLPIQPHWDHKGLKLRSSLRYKCIGVQGF